MPSNQPTVSARNARALMSASALSAALALATTTGAQADEALADLVEEVSPAVVTVLSTIESAPDSANFDGLGLPQGSPFEEFFRQFGPGQQFGHNHGRTAPQAPPRQGLGSGFILDADGWIVTNHHVVDGAGKVTVRLSDDREFTAEIVGTDPQTDLALLRIDAKEDLPHVTLGDSDEIRVGADVMAVGNPFGLGGTVTTGIVSAKGRNISAGPYADFLQTDAAINKGNSGGPLFNMEGEVVGVNSAIYSPTGGSVGVGFAVASNIVDQIVDDLRDDGQVDRGWLGVSIQDLTPDLSAALGLEAPGGALVSSVVDDSPADGALQAGDVILEFAGDPVDSSRDLPRLVAGVRSGETAEITVQRNGEKETVKVQIGAFQAQAAAKPGDGPEKQSDHATLGATVAPLTDTARQQIGVDETVNGVVVTSVATSGPAAEAGVQVGDVIMRLGNEPVTTTDSLKSALKNKKETDPALLLINRAGQQIFVAVKLA